MFRAKVRLLNGDSLSFELRSDDYVKTLRAKVESELNVSRFHEVKLLMRAQGAAELKDEEQVSDFSIDNVIRRCQHDEEVSEDLELQAIRVFSWAKAVDALEAEREAAKQEGRPVSTEMLDTFLTAVQFVDNAPSDIVDRILCAVLKLARVRRYLQSSEYAERLGDVYGRFCENVQPLLDEYFDARGSFLGLFAARAFARMAERQISGLKEHKLEITEELVGAFVLHDCAALCRASDATLTDLLDFLVYVKLSKRHLRVLDGNLDILRYSRRPNAKSGAERLESFLNELRARLASCEAADGGSGDDPVTEEELEEGEDDDEDDLEDAEDGVQSESSSEDGTSEDGLSEDGPSEDDPQETSSTFSDSLSDEEENKKEEVAEEATLEEENNSGAPVKRPATDEGPEAPAVKRAARATGDED
eukprot:TRINITY_DN19505_c0_g4_i1.p2 TRINITY_DN19505_c0_g4~~TRINITY_DN19505_c0_g4_i1.p2  ORF type:complete len:419 (-),score=99.79 TRINITY_DN19505_c0_g4_i1:210-1466(-)